MDFVLQTSEYAFPGYTLTGNYFLEPNLHQISGDIVNPDLVLAANVLCAKCKELMMITETQYSETSTQNSSDKQSRSTTHLGQKCLASTPFYDSDQKVKEAVENGCYICAMLLTARIQKRERISRADVSDGVHSHEDQISTTAWWNGSSWSVPGSLLIQQRRAVNKDYHERRLWIESYKANDDHTNRDISMHLSASNASQATFDLAASWLKPHLDEYHKLESNQYTEELLPKRLLDVGAADQSQVHIVYPKARCLYLTSSHSWGKADTHDLILSCETHDKLVNGYDDQSLPRLFRDCVHVTRRLGFRYLWIDSLCIRQDDEEDKAEEIVKMGNIYAGSFCNISAVSAENGRASLFTKYLPFRTAKATFRSTLSATGNSRIVHEGTSSYALSKPLYERAWVVQERLLAPRTIEYTHLGIKWYSTGASSKGPAKVIETGLSRSWNTLLKLKSTEVTEESKIESQHMWMTIVTEYTSCLLTCEEDRKVALLGVISVLQKRTGLSFSCGLCKDFLPYSLFWHMDINPRDSIQGQSYSSPSWSSTFLSRRSSQNSYSTKIDHVRNRPSECSIDEKTLVLSFTANCISSLVVRSVFSKAASGIFRFKSQSLRENGEWSVPCFSDLDKKPQDVTLQLDYADVAPTEVDLVSLYENLNTFGLVLSKSSAAEGLWERIGVFHVVGHDVVLKHPSTRKTYHVR